MMTPSTSRHFPAGTCQEFIADDRDNDISSLKKISPLVTESIANGYYPGAVILAAQDNKIIYRGVFGSQSLIPSHTPMCADTIFDVASLTKVVVTTTAIMQLVEKNKLSLDAPVADYWPDFSSNDKATITIRDCLTHTSGLQATIPSHQLNEILTEENRVPDLFEWQGMKSALEKILALHPMHPRNKSFLYSDINFIVLGHLIEVVSDMKLDAYAHENIFNPLGMQHSYFLPPAELLQHIAPTQIMSGELRWGEAHDPTCHLMGGVAGMAGMFSTAQDLGIFAQAIIDKGRTHSSGQILKPESISTMTSIQTPSHLREKRGLGWDISSPLSCRGNFSASSFGHTGWTGVSMWIDPENDAWLIILTSRTHPAPASVNKLVLDRSMITKLVSSETCKSAARDIV